MNTELNALQLSPQHQQEGEQWDDVVMRSIEAAKPLLYEFIEFCDLLARYGTLSQQFEVLHGFFEKILQCADVAGKRGTLQDNFIFIGHELFLTTVAVLIKHLKFDEVNALLSQGYSISDKNSGESPKVYPFGVFSYSAKSVESLRCQRLYNGTYRGRASLTGQEMRKRAMSELLSINDLRDADYALFLRSNFGSTTQSIRPWWPCTLGTETNPGTLPLFAKATYHEFFTRLKPVLGIKSKVELVEKINTADQEQKMPSFSSDPFPGNVNYHKHLMNLDALDTLMP